MSEFFKKLLSVQMYVDNKLLMDYKRYFMKFIIIKPGFKTIHPSKMINAYIIIGVI